MRFNEISDRTLVSYLTKVDADSQKHEKDPTKRSAEKRNRSVTGFQKAFNKLDSREPDGTLNEDLQADDGNRYRNIDDFLSQFEADWFDEEQWSDDGMELRGYIDGVNVMAWRYDSPRKTSGYGNYDDGALEQGVAEGSETPEKELERLKLRQNAWKKAPLRDQAATQARIRELEKQIKGNVAEGSEQQYSVLIDAVDHGVLGAIKVTAGSPQEAKQKAIEIASRSYLKRGYKLAIRSAVVRPVKQGVAEGTDDAVMFEIDSENAYNHIMKRFGSVIDWQGDTMVAPRKYWGAIQELAYSAGGEATEVGSEQGVAEGAGNIGSAIKALYQKIYAAGDDEIEYFYNASPIFAQYWDEYEGDLDSIIAEVDPGELEVIKAELESYVDDANLAEGAENPYGYEVGQQVELAGGQQGQVTDIFDGTIEVLLPDGRTAVVDFQDAQVLDEGKPREKEADYGPDYQDMVARVKKLAGLGPLKTVYDPNKRVYKNVPVAVQPAQQPKKER